LNVHNNRLYIAIKKPLTLMNRKQNNIIIILYNNNKKMRDRKSEIEREKGGVGRSDRGIQ